MPSDDEEPDEEASPDQAVTAFIERLRAIDARADQDLTASLAQATDLLRDFRAAAIEAPGAPQLLVNMTSLVVNLGGDLHDEAGLSLAIESLNDLLGSATTNADWVPHARYNRATALDLVVQ